MRIVPSFLVFTLLLSGCLDPAPANPVADPDEAASVASWDGDVVALTGAATIRATLQPGATGGAFFLDVDPAAWTSGDGGGGALTLTAAVDGVASGSWSSILVLEVVEGVPKFRAVTHAPGNRTADRIIAFDLCAAQPMRLLVVVAVEAPLPTFALGLSSAAGPGPVTETPLWGAPGPSYVGLYLDDSTGYDEQGVAINDTRNEPAITAVVGSGQLDVHAKAAGAGLAFAYHRMTGGGVGATGDWQAGADMDDEEADASGTYSTVLLSPEAYAMKPVQNGFEGHLMLRPTTGLPAHWRFYAGIAPVDPALLASLTWPDGWQDTGRPFGKTTVDEGDHAGTSGCGGS